MKVIMQADVINPRVSYNEAIIEGNTFIPSPKLMSNRRPPTYTFSIKYGDTTMFVREIMDVCK